MVDGASSDDLSMLFGPHEQMTASDYYDKIYYPANHAGGSDNTATDYRAQLNKLDRFFQQRQTTAGHEPRTLRIGDLSSHLISACMAWHVAPEPEGLGDVNETANKFRASVQAVWRHAADQGCAPEVVSVKKYPEKKTIPVCWSLEECEKILQAAAQVKGRVGDCPAGEWWVSLLLCGYNTGLRISALMTIATADVDLTTGFLMVRVDDQKHNAEQQFDLLPGTVAAISRIAPERLTRLFDDWKFDRTQQSWPALNRRLKKILRSAGLPSGKKDMWHKWRRTFATHLAAKRGRAEAQSRLGHSGPEVTARYLDPRFLAGEKLADSLPEPKSPGPQLRLFQG